MMVCSLNCTEKLIGDYGQHIFSSLLLDGCIENGRDCTQGGAKYNHIGIQGVGVADVADSLTVLKTLVFEQKKVSAEEIMEAIHAQYNEHSANDWCYTNSNAMICTMALLCGGGDFGKSICLAVQPGFDTDCNGATVGSIVGIMNGENAIDPYWYAPFEKRLYTSISGYNLVEVDDLAKKTAALVK
jgi:hypothetical protein